jgi:hypothetical protein
MAGSRAHLDPTLDLSDIFLEDGNVNFFNNEVSEATSGVKIIAELNRYLMSNK